MDDALKDRGTGPPGERLEQIKILNWNIERGMKLSKVIDLVKRQDPDVCIFQEVDLNAKRTGRLDVAAYFAAQFQFNYVFGVEFEELSQGSKTERAYHGQAVFARRRILAPRIIPFRRQSDFWRPRWYLPDWSVLQRRRGGRMALTALLEFGDTQLVIYDLHLESQGDDGLRLAQLREVVEDARRYPPQTAVILAGDLNTRNAPSPLRDYLLAAGFVDAADGCKCDGTKPNGWTLDWIFVRGPAVCSATTVHRNTNASDHYPLSTVLSLRV